MRAPACTMNSPEMKGFVREEDTAGSEPHFTLDGFEGLRKVLDQAVPPCLAGNYEEEIRARYEAFRNLVPAPCLMSLLSGAIGTPTSYKSSLPKTEEVRNFGVIGDRRTSPPIRSTFDPNEDCTFGSHGPQFGNWHSRKLPDLLRDPVPDVFTEKLNNKRAATAGSLPKETAWR